ncbi:hypothetical protein [Pelagibaculum spongiae]|nr:hypothetical protein [Pelagibaculum spongiae]
MKSESWKMIKQLKSPFISLSILLLFLGGCRQEPAQLSYQFAADETAVITRNFTADKEGSGVMIAGCIHTPNAWGAPTNVNYQSTEQISNAAVAVDISLVASASLSLTAQGAMPKAEFNWHCYRDPAARDYAVDAPASISFTLNASRGEYQISTIASIVAGIIQGNDAAENVFQRLAIHNVNYDSAPKNTRWEAQTITEVAGSAGDIALGDFQESPLKLGNNAVFIKSTSTDDGRYVAVLDNQYNFTINNHPTPQANSLGFSSFSNGSLLLIVENYTNATSQPETRAYTSINGADWIDRGIVFTDQDFEKAFYDSGSNQFVITTESGNIYKSIDGVSWTSELVDVLATSLIHYAASDDYAVTATNDNPAAKIYYRSSGSWATVTLPSTAINYKFSKLFNTNNRFYALASSTLNGDNQLQVLTSETGQQWQAIRTPDPYYEDVTSLNPLADGRVLLVDDSGVFISDSSGVNWLPIDARGSLPAIGSMDILAALVTELVTTETQTLISIHYKSATGALFPVSIVTTDSNHFMTVSSHGASLLDPNYNWTMVVLNGAFAAIATPPFASGNAAPPLQVASFVAGADLVTPKSGGGSLPIYLLFLLIPLIVLRLKHPQQ